MFSTERYFYLGKDGSVMQKRRVHPALTTTAALAVVCAVALLAFRAVSAPDSRLKELSFLKKQVQELQQEVDRISQSDDQLRMAARLPAVPADVRKMGTGGNRSLISGNTDEGLIASTEQLIEQLTLQIEHQKESHEEIRDAVETNQSIFLTLPAIKPVRGFISSGFGMRMHPVYKRVLFHAGTDFSAPVGSAVQATGKGIVAFSGFDKGYGKKVIIDHGHGYQTMYAHLSKAVVRQGQRVNRGEIVAMSGNSGISTAPHLHYEVRKDDIQVNPTAYFFDDMTPEEFMTMQNGASVKDDSNS
jgi:murein DD-endopeptidase MepM/ murein hydrolase activator NlpD